MYSLGIVAFSFPNANQMSKTIKNQKENRKLIRKTKKKKQNEKMYNFCCNKIVRGSSLIEKPILKIL